MTISSGIDKMFGRKGFFNDIRTKSVEDILKECEDDRLLYSEQVKKIYFYGNGEEEGEKGKEEETNLAVE